MFIHNIFHVQSLILGNLKNTEVFAFDAFEKVICGFSLLNLEKYNVRLENHKAMQLACF